MNFCSKSINKYFLHHYGLWSYYLHEWYYYIYELVVTPITTEIIIMPSNKVSWIYYLSYYLFPISCRVHISFNYRGNKYNLIENTVDLIKTIGHYKTYLLKAITNKKLVKKVLKRHKLYDKDDVLLDIGNLLSIYTWRDKDYSIQEILLVNGYYATKIEINEEQTLSLTPATKLSVLKN